MLNLRFLQNRIENVCFKSALGTPKDSNPIRVGRLAVLGDNEENEPYKRLQNLSKRGFGLTSTDAKIGLHFCGEGRNRCS
jgi:hypothetical protein